MAVQVQRFQNRTEAGRLLAGRLRQHAGPDDLVVLRGTASASFLALGVALFALIVAL